MYHTVLVDDEPVSLRFLRNYILRYFPVFHITAEFETGIDALNYLRENKADLLITDIKMPVMNGVELAKCLRRIDKTVHIVMISGYAEFDFAKGALEAAADDYLLKPLSLTNMQKTFSSIAHKMDREHENCRYKLLRALADGRTEPGGLLSRYFSTDACCLVLMRIGNLSRQPYLHSVNDTWASQQIPQSAYRLNGRDQAECLLVSLQPLDIRALNSGLQTEASCTMIYDSAMLPFSQLKNRIQTLYHLMDASVILGKSQCLLKTEIAIHEFSRMPQNELLKIDYGFISSSYPVIREALRQWGKTWEAENCPQCRVEKYVSQIVERFLSFIPASQTNPLRLSEQIDTLYSRAASTENLMTLLDELLYRLVPESCESRHSPDLLYHKIEEYIEDHYSAPLTIQSVSSVIGISPSYLSKLFRKYGEKTFNETLTYYRMKNACHLLIHNTELQLNDIALMVGYDSQSYFCKVFRQYTGMTPGQYAKEEKTAVLFEEEK